MPNSGKGAERPDSHIFLLGMQNSIATLENSSVVSYKVKYVLVIQLSDPTPKVFNQVN